MIDRRDLDAAVEAGLLAPDQASPLADFLSARSRRRKEPAPSLEASGETLRFLANFNDIFLAIGLIVLLAGIGTAATLILPPGEGLTGPTLAINALIVAGAAWALAEYFCARRRLLLPSMVLATAVTLGVGFAAVAVRGPEQIDEMDNFVAAWRVAGNMSATFAGACLAAAALFFLRFRLPFALFLIALAAALLAYTLVGVFGDIGLVIGGLLSLMIGLVTLAIGIGFDASDPKRLTRRADSAFWLHLAAAPQIILGLRGLVSGAGFSPSGAGEALVLLGVLLAFSITSLALNRRALIVSGLLTYGLALSVVLGEMGTGVTTTLAITAIILGGAVVLLGGGWSTARRAVLRWLPKGGALDRIFPPEPARI